MTHSKSAAGKRGLAFMLSVCLIITGFTFFSSVMTVYAGSEVSGDGTVATVGGIAPGTLNAEVPLASAAAVTDFYLTGGGLDDVDLTYIHTDFAVLERLDLGPATGPTMIAADQFKNNTTLNTVTLPAVVTGIGVSAFEDATNLENVALPSNLEAIGAKAFAHTKITTIRFPASLTEISSGAFSGTAINSITFDGNDPPTMAADAFPAVTSGSLVDVTIPAGADPNAYLTALAPFFETINITGGTPVTSPATITIMAVVGGTITVSSLYPAPGETVVATAAANSGYRFARWHATPGSILTVPAISGGGVSTPVAIDPAVNPVLNFTMPALASGSQLQLGATFIRSGGGSGSGGSGSGGSGTTFIITAEAGEGGTIEPDGRVNVTRGNDQSFTIRPNSGYRIAEVTVDGESQGAVRNYTFKDVQSNHTILATFMKDGLPFTDVGNHWALDAINYVYTNGLFNGITETRFGPDQSMTRGMLIAVLGRMEGIADGSSQTRFYDVNDNQYYASHIAWGVENGIVQGLSFTAFGPNQPVTREQAATLISRYANYRGITLSSSVTPFSDQDQVSTWAETAVLQMKGGNIMQGRGDNLFVPASQITRAEVAQILMNFIRNYVTGT